MDDHDRTRLIVICAPDTTADVVFALRRMHVAGRLTAVVDTFPIRPQALSPLDALTKANLDFVTAELGSLIRSFDEASTLLAPARPPTWAPIRGHAAMPPPPPPLIRSRRPRRRP